MSEIREVLNNAIMSYDKFDTSVNAQVIVNNWFDLIEQSKQEIFRLNEIDTQNNNGFKIDYSIIDSMKDRLIQVEDQYKRIISMKKDMKNNYILGKEQDNLGTVCLVYDGNTYTLIEFIAKCILSHNALIVVCESEFAIATNELFVLLAQKVLKASNVPEGLIQFYYTGDIKEVLFNNVSIAKVFVSGNKEFQRRVVVESKMPVVTIGYNYSEIYVEDDTNIELIKNIIEENPQNIDIYVKNGIDDFDNAIVVGSMDEAIMHINSTGSGYSSAIFTSNPQNGAEFLKEVKSSYVGYNVSPLVEIYDCLDMRDLLMEKNMYYPTPLKGELRIEV